MERVIELHEFTDLNSLENSMFDLVEGDLNFGDRRIKLNLNGERTGYDFYRAITNPNSGWVVVPDKIDPSNISYWIAPNAVMVFPEIIKKSNDVNS